MPSLFVVTGKSRGQCHTIGSGTTLIGRDDACDIQILDDQVSRRHLEIRCEDDDRYEVVDLESANGVFIADQRVRRSFLRDGDVIMLGESKVLFSREEALDPIAAMASIKRRGEHGKSTLIVPPPPEQS